MSMRWGMALVVAALGLAQLAGGATAAGTGRVCAGHAVTIMGTPGSDHLRGTGGPDVIDGLAGADVIDGRGGDDVICGSAGRDVLRGAGGNDVGDGGAGAGDRLMGGRNNDLLLGGPGADDYLDGGLGDDSEDGGAGNHDIVIGSQGADSLHGGPGSEDLLRGNGSPDLLDGGPGEHDIASFADAPIDERPGNAGRTIRLSGAPPVGGETLKEVEDVVGSPGNDFIYGDPLTANRLEGGPGRDVIIAQGEGDLGSGNSGFDLCLYFQVGATSTCEKTVFDPYPPPTVSEDPSVVSTVELSEGIAGTTIAVIGNAQASQLSLTRASHVLHLSDAAGISTPGGCVALTPVSVDCPLRSRLESVSVSLGPGDDDLEVDGPIPVVVSGGSGDDILVGGDAADTLEGGIGGSDVLRGGAGSDALIGGTRSVLESPEPDALFGGPGADLLLDKEACNGDVLDGGTGSDNASFVPQYGVFAQLDGKATALPRWPGCRPSQLSNDESLEGSNYDDLLLGNDADNTILGRTGSDRMLGKGGDDTLLANDGERDMVINCGPGRDHSRDDEVDPRAVSC